MTPEESLANAIILQAVYDYRMALKAQKRDPESASAKDAVNDLERFFRSQWFMELTDIDGGYLIRRLKEEVFDS